MEKKPDFEKLVENLGWICDGTSEANDMLRLCETIWTDYVTPLQSQLSAAEKRNERLLSALKENVLEKSPDFFDNPNGPYEYSCPFCCAKATRKGGEPHATMHDIKHDADCGYLKSQQLINEIEKQ